MRRGLALLRAPLAAGFLLAVAALWQGASPAPAQAAQSGLSWVSVGTWRPDPAGGRVHVALRVVATSHTVDTPLRRYYFASLQLTLPASSVHVAATDDRGRALSTRIMASSPYGVVVTAAFPQRLYSGQSGSFNLDFDLVDPGGSTDRDLHIGRDLVSFPVCAFGSPGTPGSSATVIFPPGLTVQEQFGNLTRSVVSSGETVYTTGTVADPGSVNAWFTAFRNVPKGDFLTRNVTVAPLQIELRYWSDDPGWADQVSRVLQSGYPMLRDLIGLGDPSVRRLTVEEATTQGGFSGEYDPSGGLVRISYFADPMAILHEMAHLWFDGDMASDRWIDEGFASYYAEQAVVGLGLPDHPPQLSDSLMRSAVPLNDWIVPDEPGTPREAYLYGASLAVAREIAHATGADRLRGIWLKARSGAGAFDPLPPSVGGGGPSADSTPPVAPSAMPLDWQSLLDFAEQATGDNLAPIWREWVVDVGQVPVLTAHVSTLETYRSMQQLAAGWRMPPDLRQSMATWNFALAEMQLRQVRNILAARSQIGALAPIESTSPPLTLQLMFEGESTASAMAEANRELAVLAQLAEARQAGAAGDGAARDVGLLGSNPDKDLEDARKAFARGDLDRAGNLAAAARSAWAGAASAGQVRLVGAATCLIGVLLLLLALSVNAGLGVPRPRQRIGIRGRARSSSEEETRAL